MLPFFRGTAILEGISYLLLFALSMPLKYWAGIGAPNLYIGYVHGFLFILYVVLALVLWQQRKWSVKHVGIILLASLLPFGTFYVESRLLRRI